MSLGIQRWTSICICVNFHSMAHLSCWKTNAANRPDSPNVEVSRHKHQTKWQCRHLQFIYSCVWNVEASAVIFFCSCSDSTRRANLVLSGSVRRPRLLSINDFIFEIAEFVNYLEKGGLANSKLWTFCDHFCDSNSVESFMKTWIIP